MGCAQCLHSAFEDSYEIIKEYFESTSQNGNMVVILKQLFNQIMFWSNHESTDISSLKIMRTVDWCFFSWFLFCFQGSGFPPCRSNQVQVDNHPHLSSLQLIILSVFKCLVITSSLSGPLLRHTSHFSYFVHVQVHVFNL